MKAVRVMISGRVQGVGFRYFARRKAKKLNVFGWIQNLGDGSVDAVFQGEDKNVDEMVKWCYEGSPLASVDKVDVRGEPMGKYEEFEILK